MLRTQNDHWHNITTPLEREQGEFFILYQGWELWYDGAVRVEVIQELDPGDATLEIPWASHLPPLRYVDLKRFPAKIESLEEVRRHPPLAGLLRSVNGRHSPFRTAKCDVWITTRLAEDERIDFPRRFKVGSYVDLTFDTVQLRSSVKAYLGLCQMLEEFLRPCRVEAQAELAIRRCLFHPKGRWGFHVTIFVHAYGATRGAAKEQWDNALDCLGKSLTKAGRMLSVGRNSVKFRHPSADNPFGRRRRAMSGKA